jgi:hypothetical protein
MDALGPKTRALNLLLLPGVSFDSSPAPSRALVPITHTLSEITGPIFGEDVIGPSDDDPPASMQAAAGRRG